jgi:hypothetical protein
MIRATAAMEIIKINICKIVICLVLFVKNPRDTFGEEVYATSPLGHCFLFALYCRCLSVVGN